MADIPVKFTGKLTADFLTLTEADKKNVITASNISCSNISFGSSMAVVTADGKVTFDWSLIEQAAKTTAGQFNTSNMNRSMAIMLLAARDAGVELHKAKIAEITENISRASRYGKSDE